MKDIKGFELSLESAAEFFFDKGFLLLRGAAAVVVAFVALKLCEMALKRFFNARSAKGRLSERTAKTLYVMIDSAIKYTVYATLIFTLLIMLGVNPSSLLAVLGAGSVAVGLGAQSVVKDIIGGFFILLEDQFGVGDTVVISGFTGVVEAVTLRITKIRGFDGSLYIVPNGLITSVINMSKEYINAIVDIDVAYDEDAEYAIKVLNDEMDRLDGIMEGVVERPEVLGVAELSETRATIRIVAKCAVGENYRVERELKLIIKKRLADEGIKTPLPQREVRIVKED